MKRIEKGIFYDNGTIIARRYEGGRTYNRVCPSVEDARIWRSSSHGLPTLGHAAEIRRAKMRAIMSVKNYTEADRLLSECLSHFGSDHPICSITELDIASWLQKLRAQKSKNPPHNPLSPKSVWHRHQMLNSLLVLAREKGWIRSIPRVKTKKNFGTRQINVTVETFNASMDHMAPAIRALSWLAIMTGMRVDDLRRQRWSAVERDELWYQSTKTDVDGLCIPVIGPLVDALAQLPRSSDFMFPGRDGRPMTGKVIRAAIRRACEDAGVPVWTPHQIRHLAASEALEMGFDQSLVQTWIGWLSPDMLRRYGRPKSRVAGLVKKLGEAVAATSPDQSTEFSNVVRFRQAQSA